MNRMEDTTREVLRGGLPPGGRSPRSPLLDRCGIQAVIFDMDGVLVETMSLHYEAYCRVLKPAGLSVQPIEISSREGLGTPAVLASLSEARGWGLSPEQIQDLADRRRRIFWEIYEHRVFPEIPELLTFLKEAGYQLAVVSGATRQSLVVSLEQYRCSDGQCLGGWFPLIISGTEVARGKPYPDPYIAALARLGLEGKQALVVENAPAGITAAKEAGCYCVAVESTLPKSYLAGADWVVRDHAALLRLLRDGT